MAVHGPIHTILVILSMLIIIIFPKTRVKIDDDPNNVHQGHSLSMCAESRWVDYGLTLNTLLGNKNAATRLINYKQ